MGSAKVGAKKEKKAANKKAPTANKRKAAAATKNADKTKKTTFTLGEKKAVNFFIKTPWSK